MGLPQQIENFPAMKSWAARFHAPDRENIIVPFDNFVEPKNYIALVKLTDRDREFSQNIAHITLSKPSVIGKAMVSQSIETVEEVFDRLCEKWKQETRKYSSLTHRIFHPAYQEIIAMGPSAVPSIMEEFEDSPAYWTPALKRIARRDVAENAKTLEELKDAWRQWAKPYIINQWA